MLAERKEGRKKKQKIILLQIKPKFNIENFGRKQALLSVDINDFEAVSN